MQKLRRIDERSRPTVYRHLRHVRLLVGWTHVSSKLANWASQSAIRGGRGGSLPPAAIGNGRTRGARVCRKRLHLLSQRASPRRLRGRRHRAQVGNPPQRAARLHLRAASVSRENAHRSGSCEYRRTRTRRAGESVTEWRRCSQRVAFGSSKCCSIAFAAARWHTSRCCARCETNWFACSTSSAWITFAGSFARTIKLNFIGPIATHFFTGRFACRSRRRVRRFASAGATDRGSFSIARSDG